MASSYDVKNIKIRAIKDWVIITDMDFGDQVTTSGIIIQSDNAKAHGVKPRWGKVYKIGPDQKDVKEGQWILIEHGRWTRKMKINDGTGEKEIQRVDITGIMAVADEKPNDVYIGTEYSNGQSLDIRPEDFGAR